MTGNIGPIPVVVHTLGTATNKVAALVSVSHALQASGQASQSGGVNQMMLYAIQCDEPWESGPPAALSDQRGSFYYQTDLEAAQLYQFVCPLIPKSAAAVGHERLTVSTRAGAGVQRRRRPDRTAAELAGAQQFFPDSRDIALPGQGHNTNAAGATAPVR